MQGYYRRCDAAVQPLRLAGGRHHDEDSRQVYLSVHLIDADPDVPAKNMYRRRFGGLRRAYALAGYFGSHSEIVRATRARLFAPSRRAPIALDGASHNQE